MPRIEVACSIVLRQASADRTISTTITTALTRRESGAARGVISAGNLTAVNRDRAS